MTLHQERPRALGLARAARLVVLAALFVLAACNRPKEEERVLRVASQKGSTKAMMLASGALDGAPYRVEWAEFPAAQHLLEALGAGAVDCGGVGDAPFQFAYQGGSPVKAVQAMHYEPLSPVSAVLVPATSKVRVGVDLRGLRIATGRGSAGHYFLLRALEAAGLKASDVTIVFLSPADANAAFSSGAVDAWSTWNPYLATAVLHGGAHIVESKEIPGTGFMVANAGSIQARHALLADFLARHQKALDWANANVDAYAAVLAKETALPLDVARFTANRRITAVPIDAVLLAEQRDVLTRFVGAGALEQKRDFEQAFDHSFFEPIPHKQETP